MPEYIFVGLELLAIALLGPYIAVGIGKGLKRAATGLRAWLIRQSDVYPPRWYWPVVRIYGGPDGQESRVCYMTRIIIGYQHRSWKQLYIHIFHREDMDRDPHDHPFGFWTFPLWKGYWEEVFEHDEYGIGCFKMVWVAPWRWHFRPAEHSHRIVATGNGKWPLVTVVIRTKNERRWGFWTRMNNGGARREHTPFREYVYEGVNANVPGPDASCPGQYGGRFNAER